MLNRVREQYTVFYKVCADSFDLETSRMFLSSKRGDAKGTHFNITQTFDIKNFFVRHINIFIVQIFVVYGN